MKEYKIIKDTVKAVQWDGSEEHAQKLEDSYINIFCDWNEAGVFDGIRVVEDYFISDIYMNEGDYVVLKSQKEVYFLSKSDFKEKYYTK